MTDQINTGINIHDAETKTQRPNRRNFIQKIHHLYIVSRLVAVIKSNHNESDCQHIPNKIMHFIKLTCYNPYMLNGIKKLWKSLGPGLITGASDDDPSGIITYSIAGARLVFSAVWTMLYTLPLMIVIQEMSARIGISSSCGLTGNIKKYYSRTLLFFISTLI